jgi:hypothetical protein
VCQTVEIFKDFYSGLKKSTVSFTNTRMVDFFLIVLRIHEILVRIRIRIRGSIPLTYGSGCGSDPAFSSVTLKTSTKNYFFGYYFVNVYFTTIFKNKNSYRSHKTVGINVFHTIFA